MEAVMFQTSPDQTLYQQKSHVVNSNRINNFYNSRSYENFSAHNLTNMGLLQAPYSVLQQPPLLPLPPANRRININSSTNRTKSKSPTKKFNSNSPKKPVQKDHVKRVLPFGNDDVSRNRGISSVKTGEEDEVEIYSGSVVLSISPPPSSLPLPNFCMRPKMMMMMSCNAPGIDTGATDDLRRLLRIQ